MAFFGIFLMMLPFLAIAIGVIIALFIFLGICLVTIGITGVIMNKIDITHPKYSLGSSGRFYNTGSIVLGIVLMLLPLGYVLAMLTSLLIK